MASRILADVTASVTELQKDPMGTAASGNGASRRNSKSKRPGLLLCSC